MKIQKILLSLTLVMALSFIFCTQAFAATQRASGSTTVVLNGANYTCKAYAYTDGTKECGYTTASTTANISRTHTAVYVRFKTASDGNYLGVGNMISKPAQSGLTYSLYTNCPYSVTGFLGIRGPVIFRGSGVAKEVSLSWGQLAS
ncbi:MAG: hypothetical protein Q3985_03605 [Eubacteriales bacterium]|nr:hypothetical protein [Eubacteriales bacterium]